MIKPNENQVLPEEKSSLMKTQLEANFKQMLEIMEFNTEDPQLKDTPKRMAKMYVDELLSGCYTEKPKVTVFPNETECYNPVFLGPIELKSLCSHHFLPFVGKVYIEYIPTESIVGISKLSRLVTWLMRRAQIQEQFTEQLVLELKNTLETENVIVHVKATHLCMTIRGVNQPLDTVMCTTASSGLYEDSYEEESRFMKLVQGSAK